MKKILFFFAFFTLLGLFLFFYTRQTSAHPLALSKEAFNTSIGINRFGEEFIFEKSLDKKMGKLAYLLIEKRAKEWHEKAPAIIPLEIHQIWEKEGPLPDDLARGAQSVRLFHKNTPYTLWTKKEYESLVQSMLGHGTDVLPQEMVRDVIAAIILLQKGGVVMDLEVECVQPITPLLSFGDCIIGFEPPLPQACGKRKLMLSSSVIASVANHPLIREWLTLMLQRAKLITDSNQKKDCLWVTQESLTEATSLLAKDQGKTLLVGPTYFCPISPSNIKEFQGILDGTRHRSTTKKILQSLHLIESSPYADVAQETVCIHTNGGRQGIRLKSASSHIEKKRVEAKKKA